MRTAKRNERGAAMTITLTREEAQQALDALDKVFDHNAWDCWQTAVDLLRARLAQPEPEPVMLMDAPEVQAWLDENVNQENNNE